MQNTKGKKVAVVIGATSKWQADGRMTNMLHGGNIDPNVVPVGVQWGVGGAVAQKFAAEGFFTVVTTRTESNASGLAAAIRDQGGESMVVELDLSSEDSITNAFKTIRAEAGEPDAVIYNAGYLDGRELPADKELLEHVPTSILDTAIHVAVRGPFLVAKEVLPAMRKKGEGSFLFSNSSLYYPRVMMRTLAQVLTEEYSEFGVHVANVVIDGTIDSPGTRALPRNANRGAEIINPTKIAEAFWYLHTQDRSCWSHEIQLTPFPVKPSY
jgi:NAD(P)-dependent dehydrogenase (short-subunit alcohol dehydrogenase family)